MTCGRATEVARSGSRRVGSSLMKWMLLALAIVAAAGCKPKVGGSCKIELKETCSSDKQALACHDGRWDLLACRGSGGCSKAGRQDVCDQSAATEKDTCNLASDFVCTDDKKAMLECKANKWTSVQTCLGARGCTMEAKKVNCDNTVANVGDPCREENDFACAPDGKTAVVCRGGKFTASSVCRARNGCKVANEKGRLEIECDDSIARAGDPCEKEAHFACSEDEKAILKCRDHKFGVDETCKRRTEKCVVRGELIGCY